MTIIIDNNDDSVVIMYVDDGGSFGSDGDRGDVGSDDADDGHVYSAKRTQVIDDESDYFATDSNQWLTFKQRDVLRNKEAELRAKRHASRRDCSRQVTLDFTGRRIIEEDHNIVATTGEDMADTVAEFNPDDFTVDLVNPNMRLPAAPQVHLLTFLCAAVAITIAGIWRWCTVAIPAPRAYQGFKDQGTKKE